MKVAFLFAGQGSQKIGMGADLAREFEAASRVFAEADEALGVRGRGGDGTGVAADRTAISFQ